MRWAIVLLVLGFSFTLWVLIGLVRLAQQRHDNWRQNSTGSSRDRGGLSAADVAIIIPAHNEELTIGATLESARRLVPVENIHVVADGCDDDTAAIARSYGAQVLAFSTARGKAGGIEAAVAHFELCRRFAVVLILDADTQLDENYVERGLALLNDPAMSAVAGYAHTTWRPEQLSMVGRFLVSYRTRLYAVMQWIKYGQTWRYTNVTPIVPGFASMYRTKALAQMDINPPGLVIEDFNMTFELHRKRLGKIAFDPAVCGWTQDPDNLKDYYRQIRRWWLGFWQTLRRHGLWWSGFSAALCIFLVEIMMASVALLVMALAIMLLAVDFLSGGLTLEIDWYTSFYEVFADLLAPTNLLLFFFVPDYVLTCVVAIWLRRPSLLVYGLGFLFIRLLDASAALWTVPKAWHTRSTGRWKSPRRRAVLGAVPRADGGTAETGQATSMPGVAGSPNLVGDSGRWVLRAPSVNPVVRDALAVTAILAVTGWVVAVAVPPTVLLAGAVLLTVLAVAWSYRR